MAVIHPMGWARPATPIHVNQCQELRNVGIGRIFSYVTLILTSKTKSDLYLHLCLDFYVLRV